MSAPKDNPTIYNQITGGILFRYDVCGFNGETGHLTHMDLKKLFDGKPFKIKILNLKGVDICLEDKEFISDIKFSESNRHFLKNLEAEKATGLSLESHRRRKLLTILDYDDEDNWTLTYRLRGFSVFFYQKPCWNVVTSYMAQIVGFLIRGHENSLNCMFSYNLERQTYFMDYLNNNTDVASTEYDESFEEDSDDDISHFWKESSISRSPFEPDHVITLFYKIFNAVMLNCRDGPKNWLWIEYQSVTKSCDRLNVIKKTYKDTDLYEIRSNDCNLIGVLIELSDGTSPDLTDGIDRDFDRWRYTAGINMYDGGLVLIGARNSGVMYYGNADEKGVLIPDAFMPVHGNV